MFKEKILFVNRRIRISKVFWISAQWREGGILRGGFVIYVGERFVNKVLDAGVDRKNEFMWVTVVIKVG